MNCLFKVGFIVNSASQLALLRCVSSYGIYLQSTHTTELLSGISSLNNGNIVALMVYMYRLEKLDRSHLPLTEPASTDDQVD